jgi:hypothetical protein
MVRAALAAVLLGPGMLTTACGGGDSKGPATTPTLYNGIPPTIRTTVCNQLISEGIVPMTSLAHLDEPVRLHAAAYDRRVFVFDTECVGPPRVTVRPASCGNVELSATDDQGRPLAMLVNELCSYKVFVDGHLSAVVTVRS